MYCWLGWLKFIKSVTEGGPCASMCRCVLFVLFVEKIHMLDAIAVAQLGSELFVLLHSPLQLAVYDAVSLTSRGNIILPAGVYRRNFVDMVACSYYHCLYLADQLCSCIVRLEIPPKHSEWKVDGFKSSGYGQCGEIKIVISVTSSHHLLVFCSASRMLKLFSTSGELYNTVQLPPGLVSVTCAVELIPGQYVVTHGSALHQVCVVSCEGKILYTFGGLRGSYGHLLTTPRDVAVDKDGFVYIDDMGSNRLVLLTPKLDYLHCMPNVFTKSSENLCRRMKLGKNCSRIYVVHSTYENHLCISHVTVFQI